MLHKKQYHTLLENKSWKPTFSENVDIDPKEAERQNAKFDQTGVKYTAIKPAEPAKDVNKADGPGNTGDKGDKKPEDAGKNDSKDPGGKPEDKPADPGKK